MNDAERIQHQLHAKSRAYQVRLEKTLTIIHEGMRCMQRPYVAFSGGVDSTVLLDLLYTLGYEIPVFWGDDGYDYPETLQFLKEMEDRYFFLLKRARSMHPWRDWCMEMDRPDLAEDPAALTAWGNPQIWAYTWPSLTDGAPALYDGVFLGMLGTPPKNGGESTKRQMQLRNGTRPLYQVESEHGMWHCSPLAHWTKHEIWAYIVANELPYNRAYDRLADLGVSVERRRVAPLTCFRTVQYGSVVTLKSGWPELYNTLAAVFPKVRSYG